MERNFSKPLRNKSLKSKNFGTSDCNRNQNVGKCHHSSKIKPRSAKQSVSKKIADKTNNTQPHHPHEDVYRNTAMIQHQPHFPPCFVGSVIVGSPSHLTCYNSLHGPVTASVVYGTTFYHYHGNSPAIIYKENQTETIISTDCVHLTSPRVNDAECSCSSVDLHSRCMSATATDRRDSFVSISSNSSRSVSPFLSSVNSSHSARDSGLLSMTDDDASLIHEPNCDNVTEDKLLQLVKDAAEEVMSDENLSQDSYLLRQMKRNKEGYVSIKLLGSSKKIRKITRSHNLLLLALKSSKKLEVSPSNSKVKLSNPPTNLLDFTISLTSLLLIDPKDVNGIEDITQQFKAYGELSQIRIVRPGRPLPPYLKAYANAVPQLGKVLCVTVEFETEAAAFKAYKHLSSTENKMGVALLGPKLKRSLNVTKAYSESTQNITIPNHTSTNEEKNEPQHKKPTVARLNSGDSTDSQDSGIISDDLHMSLASFNTEEDNTRNESESQ